MHELEKGRTENQDPIWDKRDRPVKRRIEREEQKGKNRNPKPIYPKKTNQWHTLNNVNCDVVLILPFKFIPPNSALQILPF